MPGIFGPSIDSDDVEQKVIAHLEAWMPTYVAEVRRQKDPGGTRWPDGIEAIRSFSITHTEGRWPENQLPSVVVQSVGEVEDPRVEEEGRVVGYFGVSILCVAEGGDEADSKHLSRLYASAVRLAIMQHPDLGNFANGVGMGPELNDAITRGVEAERNLAGSVRRYVVEVRDVADLDEGPLEPLPDPENPPDDWKRVKDGGATVKVEALRVGGFFPDQP